MTFDEFKNKMRSDGRYRDAVFAWLKKNPPPATWKDSRVAYAFTEMPVGLLSRKPGLIL